VNFASLLAPAELPSFSNSNSSKNRRMMRNQHNSPIHDSTN
jgi:hypothetical protein